MKNVARKITEATGLPTTRDRNKAVVLCNHDARMFRPVIEGVMHGAGIECWCDVERLNPGCDDDKCLLAFAHAGGPLWVADGARLPNVRY
jgi:hypothetical protein